MSSSFTNDFEKVISSFADGPYILDSGDSTLVIIQDTDYKFDTVNIKSNEITGIKFKCEFDGISCPPLLFYLHSLIPDSTCTFPMPDKLLAVSDIEGNFEKYFQLLTANNVMDSNYNWTFGQGHLVILGDLVDRGEYVTQCLWLTYYLENEATKYGGKVHYLLGNHEQMVLLGYNYYSALKYRFNCSKLRIDLSQLFSEQTVLGRWLRCKNSMVKIGDLIFVHGGISPSILQYDLSIEEINSIVRRDIDTQDYKTDESLALLTEEGILWYRGLVADILGNVKISEVELDKVLNAYSCRSFVIGHTPVDNVSKDFNGKVIRLDVDHYVNSSAFYIENGLQFICYNDGKRIKL